MKRIVVLGYDDTEALDLFGAMEAFGHVKQSTGRDSPYELRVVSPDGRPFTTESGITVQAQGALDASCGGDTLIIPGGRGLRCPETQYTVAKWLVAHEGNFRRIASVCTGIYGLAASGLLDGYRVATHWRFVADVARRFPNLRVEEDPIFIKTGKFYTSAGVLAGVDLALALIEEDMGPRPAADVARDLVVYLRRAGGQAQFSEPLRRQDRATGRFAELVGWMHAHVGEPLSVATLADRVALSSRQFRRRFLEIFETTPREYVETLRVEEARRLLIETPVSIDRIAGWVGFASADSFRRVFERRFGVAPSDYRARFNLELPSASENRS
jgi:transcriptional regulator GlxA family with amidase domain